jgi:hemerythrin-like domain-containing protein
MSKHVSDWQRQHASFGRLLDLLETQLGLFHDGERPDYDLMLDVMYYMSRYVDPFHHAKEDLAFKRLARQQPSAGAVADALQREHSQIAAAGAELVEELRAVVGGAMLSRRTVETQARAYVDCLRRHIRREEQELFPMLAQLRTEDWFLIDSISHFLACDERAMQGYRTLHRQIAAAAGCDCVTV